MSDIVQLGIVVKLYASFDDMIARAEVDLPGLHRSYDPAERCGRHPGWNLERARPGGLHVSHSGSYTAHEHARRNGGVGVVPSAF
jgi:hypothetical protein